MNTKQKKTTAGRPKKMQNNIPPWLNVILVLIVFATLIYAAIRFMHPSFDYDPKSGIHNFRLFFPSAITMMLYVCLLVITALFNDYDLVVVMFLLLLAIGMTVLAAGVFTENEHNKVKFFEVASAMLGLALGIPFGEKLRDGQKA